MKLSIVVPAYNPPQDIFVSTVNSIIAQSYRDFELIIIDDGSKTAIAKLIDEVGLTDSRIKVIHQQNGGEGYARNTGIKNSQGEFIMFVDADDYVANDWISVGMNLAEINGADVVCGKMKQCNAHPISFNEPAEYESKCFNKTDIRAIQYDMLLEHTELLPNIGYIDFGACAKIIRRTCIEDIKFNENMKISTDQVFCHQLLNSINVFVLTNKSAYYYLLNPLSVSHQKNPEKLDLMMKAMNMIKPLLLDDMVKDAFYFHVIEDFQRGLAATYFSGRKGGLVALRKNINKELQRPIVKEAIENINYGVYWSNHKKIRSLMLKYKTLYLFIITKTIYNKVKNVMK